VSQLLDMIYCICYFWKMKSRPVILYSKVTVRVNNTEYIFKLVRSDEINITQGKISIEAPLGKALLNKRAKEKVWVKTPIGKTKYQIIAID